MNIGDLLTKQKQLMEFVPHTLPQEAINRITAGLGIIEETLEYLSSVGRKPWRPISLSKEDQLEELTDILFFYLELIAMSGFSPDEIEEEYNRKWKVNIERYRKGKEGDYSWDDRATKKEL